MLVGICSTTLDGRTVLNADFSPWQDIHPAEILESTVTVEDPLYAPKAYSESQDSGRSAGSKRVPTVENHEGMGDSTMDNATEPETLAEAGPTGDRIDPEKVLELPSGTILHLYKKNSYCGKAMILNVNGVPEIYLGHKKDHLWKTRPLRVFKKTLFLQGANGVPYVVKYGDGKPRIITTQHPDGTKVLARADGYPMIYRSVSSAQEKADWCKTQRIKAEVLESEKAYYIKMIMVPGQISGEGVQPQDVSDKAPMIVDHGEFIKGFNEGQILASIEEADVQNGDSTETTLQMKKLERIVSSHPFSLEILNTAYSAGELHGVSPERIKNIIESWKWYFERDDNLIAYINDEYLCENMSQLAYAAVALTELGNHEEASKIFDVIKVKKEIRNKYYGQKEVEPLTIEKHNTFIEKLYSGHITFDLLKQAFQQFVASKDSIQKELEAKTVKELSEYGVTHAKNKAAMVKQILHSMMDKYVPGGGVLWSPFTEKYEEAVQKHINRLTDEHIQEVARRLQAEKEFHAKATTNPETIEEYEHFIRHVGEDKLTERMCEHYRSLLKEKADLEAAEKAKIPPKIETKEVGFHGHFLADKKGIKVFANHEEAKAEAEKLQGFGFNAHPVGRIIKISDKGQGPPKVEMTVPKTVKVGKDTWLASPSGYAMGFEDKDEALVVANKLQLQGYNAVASGLGILMPEPDEETKVDFTYHKAFHSKKGHHIFIAKLTEQVDRLTRSKLQSQAKKLGGYYSRYSQGGAVPGFAFESESAAQQFMAEAKGEEYKPEAVTSSSGPKSMGHGDVQMILAVHTISLDDPAMGHEIMRINTMSDKALEARIYKIKDDQKLHNFWQALAHKNKVHLAAKAMEELKARADVKLWGK